MKKLFTLLFSFVACVGLAQTPVLVYHSEDILHQDICTAMKALFPADSTTQGADSTVSQLPLLDNKSISRSDSTMNGLFKASFGHVLSDEEIEANALYLAQWLRENDSLWIWSDADSQVIFYDITYIGDVVEDKLTEKSLEKIGNFFSSFNQSAKKSSSSTKTKRKFIDPYSDVNFKIHAYRFVLEQGEGVDSRQWVSTKHSYYYDKKFKFPKTGDTQTNLQNTFRNLLSHLGD